MHGGHVIGCTHNIVDVDRFEGVSWSQDEEFIAYVAEEPANSRPVFGQSASSSGQSSSDSLEAGTWKGQGDWMEDWGESYSGKRRPVLFVANVGRYSSVRSVTKSWRYQGQNEVNERSALKYTGYIQDLMRSSLKDGMTQL